jgi:glucan phosphoethanolaminetransferase (alkaline phosphatase superfamily)
MLSEKEEQFIQYWSAVREKESLAKTKLSRGLPMAFLFSLPILLSVAAVYLYAPEWYTKLSKQMGSLSAVFVAVFGCILFFAFFRMHFKWEMNEQLYQELRQKKQQADAASDTLVQS